MTPVLGQDVLKFEEAYLKQKVLKIQTVMHLNAIRWNGTRSSEFHAQKVGCIRVQTANFPALVYRICFSAPEDKLLNIAEN